MCVCKCRYSMCGCVKVDVCVCRYGMCVCVKVDECMYAGVVFGIAVFTAAGM